jgi:hypothetical protein
MQQPRLVLRSSFSSRVAGVLENSGKGRTLSALLPLLLLSCSGSQATNSAPPETPFQVRAQPAEEQTSFEFHGGSEENSVETANAAGAPPAQPMQAAASENSKTAPPEVAAEPQPPAVEEPSKPSRPALEILTGPDTAFLINYASSTPSETARKACAQKAPDDAQAGAECASKARDDFKADVVRFRKQRGRWLWTTYKRVGSRLDETHSASVELTESTPSSVKLKILAGEKGMRAIFKAQREITINVPNDYSLFVQDPELGKLVYEAKVGLVSD